ncbi:hypothetical protein NDU88_004813 [Pleurodeles waltl]|uniref:Uncharacterized protein n=1 Tax=Pleurodeles waltl TaxID=8319 RepID=A0AAV7MUK3_PLEWA|nr:hypothetical protein NDU88_004813 [Pleurodeles waltl]
MGRHKQTDASQGNTMEQYTTPVPLPQGLDHLDGSGDSVRVPATSDEPSHAELLAAIQGSRMALEGKIETVAVEVNLLLVQKNSAVGRLEAGLEVAEGGVPDRTM